MCEGWWLVVQCGEVPSGPQQSQDRCPFSAAGMTWVFLFLIQLCVETAVWGQEPPPALCMPSTVRHTFNRGGSSDMKNWKSCLPEVWWWLAEELAGSWFSLAACSAFLKGPIDRESSLVFGVWCQAR